MGLFVPIHELIEPIDVPDFNALYREHYRNIYALIFKIVKQKEATEDILQQVYLELWENRENLSPEEISEWLLSNGFTTAMNYLKSRKLENNYIFEQAEKLKKEPAISASDESEHDYQVRMVEDAANHLPARKREVYRLWQNEGKNFEQVAGIVGISVVSVKNYLKQSVTFIRNYIAATYMNKGYLVPSDSNEITADLIHEALN